MSSSATTIEARASRLSGRQKTLLATLGLLPVIVVLMLSLRSIQGDALRRDAEQRTAAAQLQEKFAAELDTRIRALAAQQRLSVEQLINSGVSYRNALRGLVTRRNPELAVVYDDGERVYPPRDSVASTPGEALLFNRLSGQIGELVSRSYAKGEAIRWLYFDGLRGVMSCRRVQDSAVLACALVGKDDTDQLLRDVLSDFELRYAGWQLTLTDATGQQLLRDSDAMLEIAANQPVRTNAALEGAMAGWRVSLATVDMGSGKVSIWASPYFMAGLPLCAFWLLFVWHTYQRQSTELARSQERVTLAAFLSHDLRTPLTNVRLYADLIRRAGDNNDDIQSYAGVIEQELDRLDQITSDAVALARGAAMPKADSEFAPDDVIRSLLASLQPKLAAADIRVDFNAHASRFRTERSAFERVVTNLVDNASKFAPGSVLELSTRLSNDGLELIVRDYGPGLAATAAEGHGSGLGLKSVRALLEENGGSLRLDDANPGLRVTALFASAPAA